jgi:hypothetical protein
MSDNVMPQTPSRNDHRQSVVTESFRKRLGLFTQSAAHRRELQSPKDVEALLESCMAHGQLVRAEALLARFDRIVHPVAVEPLTDELVLQADLADKEEDVLETRAHLTRCPVAKRRWARAHQRAEALARRLTRAFGSAALS